MKIIHISDLHLNSYFSDSNLDRIEKVINYALDIGFDHLVISGDLTDNATPVDFDILRSLLGKYGLLRSDKLSVVIGNHDIYGSVQQAEDIFNFPEKCKNVDYLLKVREFRDYFREAFDDCIYNSGDTVFPFAKILDKTLLIGVNSIAQYSKIKNPFASNGEIKLKDFNTILEMLKILKPYYKNVILITHHHFNKVKVLEDSPTGSYLWQKVENQTMKLRKKKRFFRLFKEFNIDAVLHGHLHESGEYFRKGIRFLNAGGAIKNNTANNCSLNIINISSTGLHTETRQINIESCVDV